MAVRGRQQAARDMTPILTLVIPGSRATAPNATTGWRSYTAQPPQRRQTSRSVRFVARGPHLRHGSPLSPVYVGSTVAADMAEPPRNQTRWAGSPSRWGESAGVPAVRSSNAMASPSANPVGTIPRGARYDAAVRMHARWHDEAGWRAISGRCSVATRRVTLARGRRSSSGSSPTRASSRAPIRGRGELVEDLYQAASVGLIKAVDQREPERGVSFIAYATPRIRGEIRRHFRDTARRVMYLVRSRNAPAGSSAPKRSSWQGPVLTRPVGESDSAYKRVETSAGLGHALRKLQPRERKVLLLRFGCEFTQGEIARRIGVSQMHVSRILRNAIGAWLRSCSERVSSEREQVPRTDRRPTVPRGFLHVPSPQGNRKFRGRPAAPSEASR